MCQILSLLEETKCGRENSSFSLRQCPWKRPVITSDSQKTRPTAHHFNWPPAALWLRHSSLSLSLTSHKTQISQCLNPSFVEKACSKQAHWKDQPICDVLTQST